MKNDVKDVYSFASYLTDESNEFAYKVAFENVNECLGKYKMLYIYGAPGTGKTHMLTAMMNKARAHNPDADILYTSIVSFYDDLVAALKEWDDTDGESKREFRNKYVGPDLLLIDDIVYLEDKSYGAQEELCAILLRRMIAGKAVVIAGEEAPDNTDLRRELRGYLKNDMIVQIKKQSKELCTQILKLEEIKWDMSVEEMRAADKVIEHIVEKGYSDLREMKGAFRRVVEYCRLCGETNAMEAAKKIL